jgi:hypothetical protein
MVDNLLGHISIDQKEKKKKKLIIKVNELLRLIEIRMPNFEAKGQENKIHIAIELAFRALNIYFDKKILNISDPKVYRKFLIMIKKSLNLTNLTNPKVGALSVQYSDLQESANKILERFRERIKIASADLESPLYYTASLFLVAKRFQVKQVEYYY